jgi:hypothetical protein
MNELFLSSAIVTKPAAVGLGLAALVVLYLGFKAAKFILKTLLVLTALLALGLAVWLYYAAHHGLFEKL